MERAMPTRTVKGAIPNGVRRFYEFGPFRLDPNRHRLLRDGEIVPLSPKAIQTLTILVENPGKLLEREALMQALWADTIVEDANLTVAISQLRKAINENGDLGEFIQTIPRIGYRFVGDVRKVEDQPAPLTPVVHGATKVEDRNGNGALSQSQELLTDRTQMLAGSSRRERIRWRRIVVAAASIFVVGLIGLLLNPHRGAKLPGTSAQVKTMAVLPFETLSANPADEYLGIGLADALITQIGRIRQILVRPTGAVQKYAEKHAADPLVAGRELRVEAVLDGTVQRDANNLRVTVRLLRVGDGAVLWSGKFDEKFTDVFAVQDSISQEVAAALISNLSSEDRKLLTKRHTDNPEAYRLYLKGRYAWNKRTPAALQQSLGYFRQAIDLDPTYALAYAGLADSYLSLGDYEVEPPNETFPLARGAALRALEIDHALAEAHATLAYIRFVFDWDWAGAEQEYLRAIELKPNYATAHHWYAMFLSAMGRSDEARREIKLAQGLDPLSLIIQVNVGQIEYYAREYDKAIEQERKVLKTDPNFLQASRKLAFALEAKGMQQEAMAEWLAVERQRVFDAETLQAYEKACASSGIRGYWLQALEIDRRKIGREAESVSSDYARLGDREQAFYWLDRAYDQRNPRLAFAKVAPVYDNLRGDPRFQAFLQRMGL